MEGEYEQGYQGVVNMDMNLFIQNQWVKSNLRSVQKSRAFLRWQLINFFVALYSNLPFL